MSTQTTLCLYWFTVRTEPDFGNEIRICVVLTTPDVGYLVVVQMYPLIGSVLGSFNHGQSLVLRPPVLLCQIRIKNTRPQNRRAFLRLHCNIEQRKSRASTLFYIRKIQEELTQTRLPSCTKSIIRVQLYLPSKRGDPQENHYPADSYRDEPGTPPQGYTSAAERLHSSPEEHL